MKIIIASLILVSASVAYADQRFETVGGFCHFVINPNNADNEVFFANCQNSIVQNNDGTGSGSTIISIQYPSGAEPITETLKFTGADTGIPCVMVDSNGTTYETQDWESTYQYNRGKGNTKRINIKRMPVITYSLICRNGQQQ